jgi:hypothetical protein
MVTELLSVESWGPPLSNIWAPDSTIDPIAWEQSLKVERQGPPVSYSWFSSPITSIIAVKIHCSASPDLVACNCALRRWLITSIPFLDFDTVYVWISTDRYRRW